MNTYEAFADVLSVLVVLEYLALVLIAIRRSSFRDRRQSVREREITVHARMIEGPMLSILFIVACIIAGSRFALQWADYYTILRFAASLIRGALFIGGLWTLGAYWQVRETWLRRRPMR